MSQSSSNFPAPTGGDFILYSAPDGAVKVDVFFKDETVWLTQKALAELFAVKVPAINKHLKNIFDSGELTREATVSKMEIVRAEGGREVARSLEFYNLDAIIAVGYRVNSYQATQFRIWATKTLREFITKGFVLDDERLKRGKQVFGKDYFDELLERIREMRASERRFYQKLTDIYALAADYSPDAPMTKEFFATVQNKLHWASTGQTGGINLRLRRCDEDSHGADDVETRAGQENFEVECGGGEELFERGAREGVEPHSVRLPRSGGKPGRARDPDENGGLD